MGLSGRFLLTTTMSELALEIGLGVGLSVGMGVATAVDVGVANGVGVGVPATWEIVGVGLFTGVLDKICARLDWAGNKRAAKAVALTSAVRKFLRFGFPTSQA